MGITIFKFAFGEIFRQIYGWKSHFKARLARHLKTKSDCIFKDMPPKMKLLNFVIP